MPASTLARFDTHHGDAVGNLYALASLGHLPGVEPIEIQGDCSIISTSEYSVMWHYNGLIGDTGLFQPSPTTIYVSSGSIADVGILVKVIILDADYNRQTLMVVTNGQSGVPLAAQGIRVLQAEVVTGTPQLDLYFGTELAPVAGVPAVANTMNLIHSIHGNTHSAFGTVPKGYTMLLEYFAGGSTKNDELTFYGLYKPWINATTQYDNFLMSISIPAYRALNPIKIPMRRFNEKTDFYIGAVSGAGGASGTAYAYGVLVKNEYIGEYV